MQAGEEELLVLAAAPIIEASPDAPPDGEALKRELLAQVLRSAGEARLRLHGTSMTPTIWPGDTVTVRAADAAELRPGDIVLFSRDGLCAHRLIRKLSRDGRHVLITRGDRHAKDDPPISLEDAPQQVLGRVESVLREGVPVPLATRPSLAARVLRLVSRFSNRPVKALLRVRSLRNGVPFTAETQSTQRQRREP